MLKSTFFRIKDKFINYLIFIFNYIDKTWDLFHYHWTEEEVNTKHDLKMEIAFEAIWNNAAKYKSSMRLAAYITALEKIEQGVKLKGAF